MMEVATDAYSINLQNLASVLKAVVSLFALLGQVQPSGQVSHGNTVLWDLEDLGGLRTERVYPSRMAHMEPLNDRMV